MNKTSSSKLGSNNFSQFYFYSKNIVDYRAGARAGAAILTSRSRVKMKRLHKTIIAQSIPDGYLDLLPDHLLPHGLPQLLYVLLKGTVSRVQIISITNLGVLNSSCVECFYA